MMTNISNLIGKEIVAGGDNVLAALPDVIGSTIGEAVAGGIAQGLDRMKQAYDKASQEPSARELVGQGLAIETADRQGWVPPEIKAKPVTIVEVEPGEGFSLLRALANAGKFIAKRVAGALGIAAYAPPAGAETEYLKIPEIGDDVLFYRNLDHSPNWRISQTIDGVAHLVGEAEPLKGGGLLIVDPVLVSEALGRELPGNAIIRSNAASGAPSELRKGFAVSIQTEQERAIVNDGIGMGWDSDKINIALSIHRINVASGSANATALRGVSGTAFSSRNMPVIEGRWLRGSEGNAGLIPGQVAARLDGQKFDSWKDFREAFWKTVADTPELAAQFSSRDLGGMAYGRAPVAVPNQQYGGKASYEIHHLDPIQHGGAVYDMSNMLVVTPLYHQQVLDPSYHYGRQRNR